MTTPAWAIVGLLWPTFLDQLPGVFASSLLGCGLLLALLAKQFKYFWFFAASAWTLLHLSHGLERRLSTSLPEPLTVIGQVTGLPVLRQDMLEFRFRLNGNQAPGLPDNALLLVRWYRNWPEISPGETWSLVLRLKPPRARVNFSGGDTERWYFNQGISALATVLPDTGRRLQAAGFDIHSIRADISQHIATIVDDHPSASLLQALAVANRAQVEPQEWKLLRVTGTSHLLAISGMHIGLAAMTGFWLGRVLLIFLPGRALLRIGRNFCWLVSLFLASAYAMLAGMGSSTQRATIMLACFGFLALSNRSCNSWKILQLALLLVLVFQPLAPLEAGFWLSFAAVATLLCVFASRPGGGRRFTRIFVAQAALVLVLLPLGMMWFQQYSLLGMFTNIFAIPWVSFLVVPALLGSILAIPLDMLMETAVSPFLVFMAAEALRYLVLLLEWIVSFSHAGWGMTARPGQWVLALATVGTLLLLLPRGMNIRWCGPVLLLLALIKSLAPGPAWQVEMLDVGQGLALLLRTGQHLLVYDSGPGEPGNWSLVNSVIAPAIAQQGKSAPDRIIVSHADLDHAGGLLDLQNLYPETPVFMNPPEMTPAKDACLAGEGWAWNGYWFEVLHPGPGLPYLGNDSSCVLRVQLGSYRFLLMGDAGTAVEQRLMALGIGRQDYLFAGHHGSRSASGELFLEYTRPSAAFISTGFEHRFGFPHQQVAKRFASRSINLWSTADCGAIRIRSEASGKRRDLSRNHHAQGRGVAIESARRLRKAPWRFPAHRDCP